MATLGREISYTQVRSCVWLDFFPPGLKTFAKCFIGQMEDVIRHSKLICLSRKFFKQKKLRMYELKSQNFPSPFSFFLFWGVTTALGIVVKFLYIYKYITNWFRFFGLFVNN